MECRGEEMEKGPSLKMQWRKGRGVPWSEMEKPENAFPVG